MSAKLSPEGAYAKKLGIKPCRLKKLGGMAKLQALSPEALGCLINFHVPGNSRTVHKGGVSARGMVSRKPGMLTQMEARYLIPPQVEMPIELALGEEELEATHG